MRVGTAWYEVTVFDNGGNDWPPESRPAVTVFRALIDHELDLSRPVAAAYQSLLERYGASRYAELWEHPFPQADLDVLTDWIRRVEAWAELDALQVAIMRQTRLLGTRVPEAIAAALGQSPERIAEVMRELERPYTTRLENDRHYSDRS